MDEYAHFRDQGRDNAKGYLIAESITRSLSGAPSNAERLRLADEIVVVRDAFLANHKDAYEMAGHLIDKLTDYHLAMWWDHRNDLSNIRHLAKDPNTAMHAYNDGFWATLAKQIAGRKIGRIR